MIVRIPASVAMVGLPSEAGGAGSRALIERIGGLSRHGVRGVHIDATRAGLRPRELDRSARRDLAALLRRQQLVCSGLDVFIPPEHFVQREHADRAVAGVLGAIELAGELAALGAGPGEGRGAASVCLTLPERVERDVLAGIDAACERAGVKVADLAWPARDAVGAHIGVGIDPAALQSIGESPAKSAARLGGRVVLARISDMVRGVAGARCMPGAGGGTLEMQAYHATLGVIGYRGMAVLDVRGVPVAPGMIEEVVKRWGSE